MTFTIEQIRNYLTSCDSMGDALHFLNEERILEANKTEEMTFEYNEEQTAKANWINFNRLKEDNNWNWDDKIEFDDPDGRRTTYKVEDLQRILGNLVVVEENPVYHNPSIQWEPDPRDTESLNDYGEPNS